MHVDRDEVDRGPDLAPLEVLDERVAVDAQHAVPEPQHVEMPRVLDVGPVSGELQRVLARERLVVQLHNGPTSLLELGELAELPQPERRLYVGHIVLEAREHDLVIPRPAPIVAAPPVAGHAVQAHRPRALEECRIAGEHPALGSRHVLGRIEAEGGRVATRSDRPPAILGGHRVGRVLDHRESGPARQLVDELEVHGMARVMDRQDGSRPRGERGGGQCGIDVQGVRLHVDQHGSSARVLDHVDGGGERHGRRDDLVPRADPERHERGVQRGRARAERQRPWPADVGGEGLLEALGLRPRRDPGRAQRFHHLLDLFLADQRCRERQELPLRDRSRGSGRGGDCGVRWN